ncbi:MAG: hypothetical protein RBT68_12295 [Spirochaetia bacterium]|nr:hypothetical protein [Spirochaetia bacterium]
MNQYLRTSCKIQSLFQPAFGYIQRRGEIVYSNCKGSSVDGSPGQEDPASPELGPAVDDETFKLIHDAQVPLMV